MAPVRPSPLHPRIYAAVARIPRGRVATYGGVARLAGLPRHARLVGYALHALPGDSRVPWHRVVGADGRVKPRAREGPAEVQRALLERERVPFDPSGRIDLARFGWPAAGSDGPGGADGTGGTGTDEPDGRDASRARARRRAGRLARPLPRSSR